MNSLLKRLMVQGGYMDENTDGTGSAGGGGDDAARLAAEKTAAEKAEADRLAAAGRPTDAEAKLLKEVMDKKAKLEKAAAELDRLGTQLKQFEGIDPEAIRKMLADQKANEDKQLEAKGDYDRLKQRMADEHGKEVKTLKEQIETLTAQISKSANQINELSIGTQFGQSKFISEELTLTPTKARVIYADHFDLVDGDIVGYDKPRGVANRTPLVDQYGSPVGFDQALQKIVEADPDKDHLLRSKVKPGAGSDTRRAGGAPAPKTAGIDGLSKIGAGLAALGGLKVQ